MLPCRKLLFARSISLCKATIVINSMPKVEGGDDKKKEAGNEGKSEDGSSSPKGKSRKKRSVYDAPAYTDANGNPVEEFR